MTIRVVLLVQGRSFATYVPRNLILSTLSTQILLMIKGTDSVAFFCKSATSSFVFKVFKARLFSELYTANLSISLLLSTSSPLLPLNLVTIMSSTNLMIMLVGWFEHSVDTYLCGALVVSCFFFVFFIVMMKLSWALISKVGDGKVKFSSEQNKFFYFIL